MSNVIELHAAPRAGEPTFVLCGCADEGVPMLVQMMMGERPFIMGLICPECDAYVPVVNGYIGGETG